MPESDQIRPPHHLTAPTMQWWSQIVSDFQLESHHVRLLTLAAEAFDRAQQARAILETEGVVYHDRFGAPRKHPAVSIEENARLAFARLVRELALEEDTTADVRPPRLRRSGCAA